MLHDKPPPSKANPWLTIPASDYELHMASPGVAQLAFLNDVLRHALTEASPTSLAVLGCTTGNGFEHIDPSITTRTVAIDINSEYLRIASGRYATRLPQLALVCADLAALPLTTGSFDLIHCALVFEYVEPGGLLRQASAALREAGTLTTVLQLPSSEGSPVSPSPYLSLRRLEPIMRLIEPESFSTLARASGLSLVSSCQRVLHTGKSFWLGSFCKRQAGVTA